jgi:hypothetical protein
MKKLVRAAFGLALIAFPTLALAQDKPPDGEHHGPSPEAIAACKDKSEGGTCEYDGRRGHVAGTCHKARSGDLACFHPHPHHDGGGGN